ncbi:MAG: MerR family transcriptional regulator [Gemmatimonadales bacterium]|nr:MerR family transcriptional regulator [Gemmatimonadales bacterium]
MSPPARTYEIHEVAKLTGLSAARLRAWERRYAVVRPERQPNGYRAYSAEQVALLRAFAKLVAAGERIGDLARQPVDVVIGRAEGRALDGSPHGALLEAVKSFDRDRLESLVAQQLSLRGLAEFAQSVVLPLAQAVGDLWALGKIPIAAEHLASEVVLHALKGGLRMSRSSGPLCVAACLPGERHEWGFLCALAVVSEQGWRVHYLGADLPVDDVVEAAWTLSPAAVALSSSDPAITGEHLSALAALPGRLPPDTMAVMGGAGAEAHADALRHHGYRIGIAAFSVQHAS